MADKILEHCSNIHYFETSKAIALLDQFTIIFGTVFKNKNNLHEFKHECAIKLPVKHIVDLCDVLQNCMTIFTTDEDTRKVLKKTHT